MPTTYKKKTTKKTTSTEAQIAALTKTVESLAGLVSKIHSSGDKPGFSKETDCIGSAYRKTGKNSKKNYLHLTLRAEEVHELLENCTYVDKHGNERVAINIMEFGAKVRAYPCKDMEDYKA